MYTYRSIKELAKQHELNITDLIVLSSSNDPFYCGSKSQKRDAKWFAEWWQAAAYRRAHLRRFHYWLVTKAPKLPTVLGGKSGQTDTYLNTDRCWKWMQNASKYARYLGLVDADDITDNKSPAPNVYANYYWWQPHYEIDTPELDAIGVNVSGYHEQNAQPYHLEVWCEKSTMNDVLMPVCQRYGANLATFEGEVTYTACRRLIERVRRSGNKPTRVFYISDFDAAGQSMPVAMSRKVEFVTRREAPELDVRVNALALTAEQVAQYKLPRVPMKDTELRAANFEAIHGEGATELDALEVLYPGELARLLRVALDEYYRHDIRQRLDAIKDELRDTVQSEVNKVVARYQNEIAALRGMFDELRAIRVNTSNFAVPEFEPHADEHDNWLLDSKRDYIEQVVKYKAFKDGAIE